MKKHLQETENEKGLQGFEKMASEKKLIFRGDICKRI